ncbi:MAG: hypothetical protein LIP00_04315, partial [Parabacteroides sp.]|nr:hypothetical protein [Parabacteroides sp.]
MTKNSFLNKNSANREQKQNPALIMPRCSLFSLFKRKNGLRSPRGVCRRRLPAVILFYLDIK